MTTTISVLAINLTKGRFQACAIGLDGAVLHNRVLSRTRLTALLSGAVHATLARLGSPLARVSSACRAQTVLS